VGQQIQIHKFTTIYTNIQAHRSNNGAQNVPQSALRPPKGGPKPPRKGKICVPRPQYLSHSDQNLTEHVSPQCHLRRTICPPNSGRFSPFDGITPQKRGNLCMLTIVFVPNLPKFTQIFRPIAATKAHKMSHKGHYVPQKGAKTSPKRGNLCSVIDTLLWIHLL